MGGGGGAHQEEECSTCGEGGRREVSEQMLFLKHEQWAKAGGETC